MKKTLRLLLTMLVLFTVSACGGQPQTDTSTSASVVADEDGALGTNG